MALSFVCHSGAPAASWGASTKRSQVRRYFFVLCLGLVAASCTATPEDQAKALLRMCEDQVKAQLPYPNTYRSTSALGSEFIPVPELTTAEKETVVWDFFYDGEKPKTVVGQASDRPFLKGVGQCEIDKASGTVKAKKML